MPTQLKWQLVGDYFENCSCEMVCPCLVSAGAPDRLALAVGSNGSTFADHGMRWDNPGRNGHYAPIS